MRRTYQHPHKDADGLKAIRVAPAWCSSAWRFLVLDELTPAVMAKLGITAARKTELRRHANEQWTRFCSPPWTEWLMRQSDIAPPPALRLKPEPRSGRLAVFDAQVRAAKKELDAWSFGTDEFRVEWNDLPRELRDLRAMTIEAMNKRYPQKVIGKAMQQVMPKGYSQPTVSRLIREGRELRQIVERIDGIEQMVREQGKEIHQVMLDVAAMPARLHRLNRDDAVKAAEDLTAHMHETR